MEKNSQLLSRSDFAAAQGVSRQMVDKYVAAGMPTVNGKIDPHQGAAWVAQNILNRSKPGETYAEARTREKIADAGIKELQLLAMQGSYIDSREMQEVLERVYLGAREIWLQAISKIVMRLGLDVNQEAFVKETIYSGLGELASGRILSEETPCKAKRKKGSRKK